ncbi:hypothetical protein WN73_12920 [Bradyrhizobium sp. CCBAU 45394]|nr:hypothetical protein [Bradyrhizobium sp. CCBAU 45394]
MVAVFSDLKASPSADVELCVRLIKSIWSFYSKGAYWAVWEINIGWRGDNDLCERLADHRKSSRDLMRVAIRRNPHLSEPTKRMLLALLPFFISAVGGIFLEAFANRDERAIRSQLDILADVLSSQLDQAGAARR